nr:polysaccharide biosynthesis C-terminal domain-containing protein [Bacteroidota bacterium]
MFLLGHLSHILRHITIRKKSKLISTISIVAFAINLVLNYFMIKEYGYMGAALATLITFAFQAASTAYFAHQTTHLPWLSFFRK